MKNAIIVILAVAVLGLGGWLVYDRKEPNPSAGTSSPTQSDSPTATLHVLDYSNKGLVSVGSNIYNQTAASTLILSNNSIKTLPSQMGKMTNLQVLKLDHNLLEGSLIAEVRMMPLTTLDVSHNKMTGMPAEIGQLQKLVTLDYSYNKLTGLPNELANLKGNLKTFNLTGNPLSQGAISKLKSDLPNTQIIF